MKYFDVIIIGSSLAGTSLGLQLARVGIEVALIDKANFPRRKPCGEGLSSVGVEHLINLGISPHEMGFGSYIDGYTIWRKGSPKGHSFVDPCFPSPGIGIPRIILDDLLLSAACSSGCESITGLQIRSVQHKTDYFEVQSHEHTFRGKYLVLADGANSFIANSFGAKSRIKPNSRFGYSMIVNGHSDTPIHQVHIFLSKDIEVCCTPVGTTLMNVSLMGRPQHLVNAIQSTNLNSILADIRAHTGFDGQLADGNLSPQGIGPLNRSLRGGFHNGVFLIGDCCETLDPIGGMGMTHALISSKLAASQIENLAMNNSSLAWSGKTYEAQRRAAMRSLRGFTRLTYFYLKRVAQTPLYNSLSKTSLAEEISRSAHHQTRRTILGLSAHALINIAGLY